MRDVHEMIVDDIGEIVGRHAVAFQKHLILQLAVLDRNIAVNDIEERGRARKRHLLPDDIRVAVLEMLLDFSCGKLAAMTIVAAEGFFRAALRRLVVMGAEAAIGEALLDEFLGVTLIDIHALALDIRATVPADARPLVGNDVRRLQRVVDEIHRVLNITRTVGVLDAKDEIAVLRLREKESVKRRAQIADMHIARRARSETCTNSCQDKPSITNTDFFILLFYTIIKGETRAGGNDIMKT